MNEPIKIGDLVIIVRWRHGCLNPSWPVGSPFIVSRIATLSGKCPKCGARYLKTAETVGAGPDQYPKPIFPLSWLKRIPPLSELEGVKTEETINVPA